MNYQAEHLTQAAWQDKQIWNDYLNKMKSVVISRVQQNTFDLTQLEKGLKHAVEAMARKLAKRVGDPWTVVFPDDVRQHACEYLALRLLHDVVSALRQETQS